MIKVSPSKLHQPALVCTMLMVLSVFSARASEYTVANATELNAAISAVQPGDTITMLDGIWTNTTINLTKAGKVSAAITLQAKTQGKVVLNGASTLTFSAPYWVVSGLNFKEGAISKGQVVRFDTTHCRLTNTAFINYNPEKSTIAYYWIFFSGSNNRVDHCHFEGKNHNQPIIGNDFVNSKYNMFDYNYVYNIPYIAGVNGREILRIWGYGRNDETGDDGTFFTIENNLFEKADGEGAEIISLKSTRNIVRNNTILGTRGGIVLRSGNYNTIQGNFILGQKAAGAYGIRIAGDNHTIINNYISECDNGIIIHAGEHINSYLTPEYAPALNELTPLGRVPRYRHVQNSTIAFNTIIHVKGLALEIGSSYKASWPSQQRILIPENNKIANNLFVKMNEATSILLPKVDKAFPLDTFKFKPNIFEGNIVYGGAIDLNPMPTSGFSTQNPLISKDSDGIYRITSKSPAINAATGKYHHIVDDMDGQKRSNKKDIGADEYSNSAIKRRPLTKNDVGPIWLKK